MKCALSCLRRSLVMAPSGLSHEEQATLVRCVFYLRVIVPCSLKKMMKDKKKIKNKQIEQRDFVS